jgi:acetyl esterase
MAVAISIDRRVFLADAVDPETAEAVRGIEDVMAAGPPLNTLAPQVIRDARRSGQGAWGPLVFSDMAVDRQITGPAGPLTLRQFVPETVTGVYFHLHGGGWVLGAADQQDPRLEAIARTASVAVVSVDYRLAPEHPYPAGPDDCEAAARWLVENARAEYGSDRIVIGGESAGGHLSAVTLLRMRDRHGYTGFKGANLVYGVYDLTMTPSQKNWGTRNLILNTPIMQWFYDHYLPGGATRDPDVSPLYADLHGLPPALFSVGTLDPLLDDSLFMYGRWKAAGNEAELSIYPGAVHGFDAFPIGIARQYMEQAAGFISRCLA